MCALNLPSSFADPPLDIMGNFVSYLTLPEINKCMQICKKWKALIEQLSTWKTLFQRTFSHFSPQDVYSINWYRQYRKIAIQTNFKRVKQWDLSSISIKNSGYLRGMVFNQGHLFLASLNGSIQMLNCQTHQLSLCMQFSKPIQSIAVYQDKYLIGTDHELCVIDLAKKLTKAALTFKESIASLNIIENILYLGLKNSIGWGIQTFNLSQIISPERDGPPVTPLDHWWPQTDNVTSEIKPGCWQIFQHQLLTDHYRDKQIKSWDLKNKTFHKILYNSPETIDCFKVFQQKLVIGLQNFHFHLFNLHTEQIEQTLVALDSLPSCLEILPGQIFVVSNISSTIHVWKAHIAPEMEIECTEETEKMN